MNDSDDSDEDDSDDSPEDVAANTSGDYSSPELEEGLYPGESDLKTGVDETLAIRRNVDGDLAEAIDAFIVSQKGCVADTSNQPAEQELDSDDDFEDLTSSGGDVVEVEQGTAAEGSVGGQDLTQPEGNGTSVEYDHSTQEPSKKKTECRAKKNRN